MLFPVNSVSRARILAAATRTERTTMTAPDPGGAGVSVVTRAVISGRKPVELSWIKAHGTGTRMNDLAEARGLAAVLDGKLGAIPITSLKSTLGHTLGASGALEFVAAVLAMAMRQTPATFGLEQIDPELPGFFCRRPRMARSGMVLLLAESFGGRCTALLIDSAQ